MSREWLRGWRRLGSGYVRRHVGLQSERGSCSEIFTEREEVTERGEFGWGVFKDGGDPTVWACVLTW